MKSKERLSTADENTWNNFIKSPKKFCCNFNDSIKNDKVQFTWFCIVTFIIAIVAFLCAPIICSTLNLKNGIEVYDGWTVSETKIANVVIFASLYIVLVSPLLFIFSMAESIYRQVERKLVNHEEFGTFSKDLKNTFKAIGEFKENVRPRGLAIALDSKRMDGACIQDYFEIFDNGSSFEKLYASDFGSPYDWMKVDTLAYDSILRSWLLSKQTRKIDRIIIWYEDDFNASVASDIISVQNISGYNIRFLTYEFLMDKARIYISNALGSGTSKYDFDKNSLNYILWDIEKSVDESSSTFAQTKKGNSYGFCGEKKKATEDGKEVYTFGIKSFDHETEKKFILIWQLLEVLASPPLTDIATLWVPVDRNIEGGDIKAYKIWPPNKIRGTDIDIKIGKNIESAHLRQLEKLYFKNFTELLGQNFDQLGKQVELETIGNKIIELSTKEHI